MDDFASVSTCIAWFEAPDATVGSVNDPMIVAVSAAMVGREYAVRFMALYS